VTVIKIFSFFKKPVEDCKIKKPVFAKLVNLSHFEKRVLVVLMSLFLVNA
jgi:hypothetical protein